MVGKADIVRSEGCIHYGIGDLTVREKVFFISEESRNVNRQFRGKRIYLYT